MANIVLKWPQSPLRRSQFPPVKVTPWVNAMTGSTLDDNPAPKIPAVVATGTAFVFLFNCHAVRAVRRGAGAIVVVGGGPCSGPPPERAARFGGIWPVSGPTVRSGVADLPRKIKDLADAGGFTQVLKIPVSAVRFRLWAPQQQNP